MSPSIFNDKSTKPDDRLLAEILGATSPFLEQLREHFKQNYDDIHEEWKFYGQKYGWQLKLIQKKRTILYVIPSESCFRITFVLGDRAVEAVEKRGLPETIKETLRNARKYMEGRGIQVEVKGPEDVKIVEKLAQIKMNN